MKPQGLVRDHLWDYVEARNRQIMDKDNDTKENEVHGETLPVQQQQRDPVCVLIPGIQMSGVRECQKKTS